MNTQLNNTIEINNRPVAVEWTKARARELSLRAQRPTQIIIFGNPQGGPPFMECAQTVGIACR